MKCIISFLIVSLFVIGAFVSCEEYHKDKKSSSVLNNEIEEDDSISNVFKLAFLNKTNDSTYAFKHEFIFWNGILKNKKFISTFKLTGTVLKSAKKIYLIPNGRKEKIIYFDFDMNIGEQKSISLNYKGTYFTGDSVLLSKNYILSLEDKFFVSDRKDTIYKFRFENIGAFQPNDDLVFFIGIYSGVIGIYNGKIHHDDSKIEEEIFSFIGNIFKSRFNLNKVIFSSNFE